jgi:hypothetical protein
MSFEPLIILQKEDLGVIISKLELERYSFDKDVANVADFLFEVYHTYKVVEFVNLNLLFFRPESKSFSVDVRERLDLAKIYYKLDIN